MNSLKGSPGIACLVLLLWAVAAQAGEISMDVRGLAVGTSTPTSEDAPLQTSQLPSDGAIDETSTNRHQRWRTSSPDTRDATLADDAAIAPDAAASAGSTPGNSLSAPVKPRNRWQSLVPGAIK